MLIKDLSVFAVLGALHGFEDGGACVSKKAVYIEMGGKLRSFLLLRLGLSIGVLLLEEMGN